MSKCISALDNNGKVIQIDDEQKKFIDEEVIKGYANISLRPIAVAYQDFKSFEDIKSDILEENFTLLSILGLKDELRPFCAEIFDQLIDS